MFRVILFRIASIKSSGFDLQVAFGHLVRAKYASFPLLRTGVSRSIGFEFPLPSPHSIHEVVHTTLDSVKT